MWVGHTRGHRVKAVLKDMVRHFFIIYTGTIFGTFIYCFIFARDVVFGIDYFIQVFCISVLGDLPLLIFYSKKELTRAQMKRRQILHFCMIEIVLLIAGKWFGLYGDTLAQKGVFFAIVAFVYFLVLIFGCMMNAATADEINKRIEERKGK